MQPKECMLAAGLEIKKGHWLCADQQVVIVIQYWVQEVYHHRS